MRLLFAAFDQGSSPDVASADPPLRLPRLVREIHARQDPVPTKSAWTHSFLRKTGSVRAGRGIPLTWGDPLVPPSNGPALPRSTSSVCRPDSRLEAAAARSVAAARRGSEIATPIPLQKTKERFRDLSSQNQRRICAPIQSVRNRPRTCAQDRTSQWRQTTSRRGASAGLGR